MTDMDDTERWERVWGVAQTVQTHILVDSITPLRMEVDTVMGVSVRVPWGQVPWAATGTFDDAETLPVERSRIGDGRLDHVQVVGVLDGVRVAIHAMRAVSVSSETVGLVGDLTRGAR